MINIRSFRYHFKEGLKGLFKNRRMSIASITSVAICITMLIISLCIAINLDSTLENLENNIGVSLYLGEDVTTDHIRELLEDLESVENISNITYTSKEDALEWAKQQWGEDNIILSGLDKDNPFPRSIEIEIDEIKNQELVIQEIEKIQKNFEIKLLTSIELENLKLQVSLDETAVENLEESQTLEEEIYQSVISQINSQSYEYLGIEKISHTKKEADILVSLSTIIRVISVILILSLAIISVIIIFNTIKITLYIRKEEINIMKYIGASNSFIRFPFIIEGILIGIIGAIIPIVSCFFIYLKAISIIKSNIYLNSIIILKEPIYLFLAITPASLILGVLMGGIGSINSIKKHLDV